MIVSIHQPNYLPYLGIFHKMLRSDVFVLYDTAQFSKNDFHNRNRIKTPKGPRWLTVPVRSPGKKAIRDVEIDDSVPWAKKHAQTLEANYARASHFDAHWPTISHLLPKPWAKLCDLNIRFLEELRAWLNLRAELVRGSTLGVPPELSPTEKLVYMVRAVGGTAYLSGPGGRDYLVPKAFGDVRLVFDEFRHPVYPQLFGPFEPNLSVIDAVLNCGASETRRLLDRAS